MPDPDKEELERIVGQQMVLVYREATKQWLMEVIQPGDKQWHRHDMTSEVKATAAALQSLLEKERAEAQLQLMDRLEAESYLEQEPKGQNALRAQVVRVAALNNERRRLLATPHKEKQ